MTTLHTIRLQLGYSFREMAQDLGLKAATYQGYELNRRACPEHVITAAQAALATDRKLTAGMAARIDEG
jgi:transcriptional regulator with XRE-family HTH domain